MDSGIKANQEAKDIAAAYEKLKSDSKICSGNHFLTFDIVKNKQTNGIMKHEIVLAHAEPRPSDFSRESLTEEKCETLWENFVEKLCEKTDKIQPKYGACYYHYFLPGTSTLHSKLFLFLWVPRNCPPTGKMTYSTTESTYKKMFPTKDSYKMIDGEEQEIKYATFRAEALKKK